jgi:hypothetical protein
MNDWNKLKAKDIINFKYKNKWYQAEVEEKFRFEFEDQWIVKDLHGEDKYILKNKECQYLIIVDKENTHPNEWGLIQPNTKLAIFKKGVWDFFIAIQKVKINKKTAWKCKNCNLDYEIILKKTDYETLLCVGKGLTKEQQKYFWMFYPDIIEKWIK